MAELGWREAVLSVLKDSEEAMHYTDIADAIAKRGLRKQFGATPATAVNVAISNSLAEEGTKSPFVRVERGMYWLREKSLSQDSTTATVKEQLAVDDAGLIKAFGMYWSRDAILWKAKTQVWGQQQPNSSPVNFAGQNGVYLLHDGRAVVYVGRTTDQPLGVRLQQHTIDRLNSRWSRFSWFGIYAISDKGDLDLNPSQTFGLSTLIATMEALLIEGLEPPQNRKRGDDFRAVEFLQFEDPDLVKQREKLIVEKHLNKSFS